MYLVSQMQFVLAMLMHPRRTAPSSFVLASRAWQDLSLLALDLNALDLNAYIQA